MAPAMLGGMARHALLLAAIIGTPAILQQDAISDRHPFAMAMSTRSAIRIQGHDAEMSDSAVDRVAVSMSPKIELVNPQLMAVTDANDAEDVSASEMGIMATKPVSPAEVEQFGPSKKHWDVFGNNRNGPGYSDLEAEGERWAHEFAEYWKLRAGGGAEEGGINGNENGNGNGNENEEEWKMDPREYGPLKVQQAEYKYPAKLDDDVLPRLLTVCV